MALEVTGLKRQFKLKKGNDTITLDDPNPAFSTTDVMQFYSGIHPELTNCTMKGPEISDGVATYEFSTTVGTKG